MIKVLLADHQELTCNGIQKLLGMRDDIVLIGEFADGQNISTLLRDHRPDLLIADYCYNDDFTVNDLLSVPEIAPETNVLVISGDRDRSSILHVVQAGIPGYLSKNCSSDEVLRAVYAVTRGERFYCSKVLDMILEKPLANPPVNSASSQLTTRELEILELLASGLSTQKIADRLYLSPHTIHTHRKSIIRKLSIKSPTEFVIHAMDLGLIEPKLKNR